LKHSDGFKALKANTQDIHDTLDKIRSENNKNQQATGPLQLLHLIEHYLDCENQKTFEKTIYAESLSLCQFMPTHG